MKTVSVKNLRGERAKNMAHSMKADVDKFGRTRSTVTGKYVAKKTSGKDEKK